MKTENIISAWLSSQRERGRARREASLRAEAGSLVQVREFAGELWYSYRGVPLIRLDDVSLPCAEALAKAREAYVAYMEE